MNNLFSIFDPNLSVYVMNWSMLAASLLIPAKFWFSLSQGLMTFKMGITACSKELQHLLKTKFSSTFTLSLTTLCVFILIINALSLLPYTFAATSHLSVALTLALPFWASCIIWNLSNNFSSFVAHLLPVGTPLFLAPFMVVIELISNVIRPMTLSIRLVANVVAGHLLLALIGGYTDKVPSGMLLLIYVGMAALVILESGVALIQAYVFSTLSALYFAEVNNPNN